MNNLKDTKEYREESIKVLVTILCIVLLFLLSMAVSAASSLENSNEVFFAKFGTLCARSGCEVCGKFGYDVSYGQKTMVLKYTQSACETAFLLREAELESIKDDVLIRQKYSKDAGK